MKALGIVCTPRVGGNSEVLVQQALAGVKEAGGVSEVIFIRDKNIHPCDGCLSCAITEKCHIEDDMQELYEKMAASDGIIIGAPTYLTMGGLGVNFIDRTLPVTAAGRLANKLGIGIAVGYGIAIDGVLGILRRFFMYNHMHCVECIAARAFKPGEVKQNERAMKSAWEVGQMMVACHKEGGKFPKEYEFPIAKIMTQKYGLPSVYAP